MFEEFQYKRKNDVCIGDIIVYRGSPGWVSRPQSYPMLVIEKRYDKSSLSRKFQNIVGVDLYQYVDGLCWTVLRHDGHMAWFDYNDIRRMAEPLWVICR